MKKIADSAAYGFIFGIEILTIISVLGVWDLFGSDVIWKSFQTIGVLAVVALIVVGASHFMSNEGESAVPELPPHGFIAIRNATVSILIAAASLLALLGILAIWEILVDDVLYKAAASLAIIGFASTIVIATCLDREKNPLLKTGKLSVGMVILLIFFGWVGLAVLF